MTQRAAWLGLLTGGVFIGLSSVSVTPADAGQGDPIGGSGTHYFVAGPGNETGTSIWDKYFGEVGDEVYVGDFRQAQGDAPENRVGDGWDEFMVRQGNTFTVEPPYVNTPSQLVFSYGDPGDTVLVGDWDGDGTDSLMIRRGNTFYVENDNTTGTADSVFTFGDPGDTVLVGDWDGDGTDTLTVRRGNEYFVHNDLTSGVADYDFFFGDPDDTVLVGDWSTPFPEEADELALRRGNVNYLSAELSTVSSQPGATLATSRSWVYGKPTDTAFVFEQPSKNVTRTEYGDGLGLRRND
jgi:hypothetical protein